MKMDKAALSCDQVEWMGYTFEDPNMRTFRYKRKYFKAVQVTATAWAEKVLASDFLDRLWQMGLIPRTQACDLRVEGFGQVYSQETEFFNVPMTHWPCSVLKEAALAFLALARELFRHSLRTIDGHCYNFVIQGASHPRWCDLGSFIPLCSPNDTADLDQFVRCFVYPLLLRQKSPHLDGMMRWSSAAGLEHEAAAALLGLVVPQNRPRGQMLDILERLVNSIDFQWKSTLWSDYHKDAGGTADINDTRLGPESYNRNQMVARLLRTLKPATVVDLGANAGFFSKMATQIGAEVMAIEPDETAVERHYRDLRETKATARVKLVIGGVDGVPYQKGDLAMALALSHHLFFTAHYPWKLIGDCLAQHTSGSLLTEFMPHGLCGVQKPDTLPPAYRLELFTEALERHFGRVEVIDYPTPANCAPRIMILCTDKRSAPRDDGRGRLP